MEWTCPSCGGTTTTGLACDTDDCSYILPARNWRRIRLQQQFSNRFAGAAQLPSGDDAIDPRWESLLLSVAVILAVLCTVPGMPGLLLSVSDTRWVASNPECASVGCAVGSGVAIGLTSEGPLTTWTIGRSETFLVLEDTDAATAGIPVAFGDADGEAAISRQLLQQTSDWSWAASDEADPSVIAGYLGPSSRVTLTSPLGDRTTRWAADSLVGEAHRVPSPLSNLPGLAQIAILLFVLYRTVKGVTAKSVSRLVALASALLVLLAVQAAVAPSVSEVIGRSLLVDTYSPIVGAVQVAAMCAALVLLPQLAHRFIHRRSQVFAKLSEHSLGIFGAYLVAGCAAFVAAVAFAGVVDGFAGLLLLDGRPDRLSLGACQGPAARSAARTDRKRATAVGDNGSRWARVFLASRRIRSDRRRASESWSPGCAAA